ncbi:MAG TPA: DUF2703 domain-containing protein, partial [Dehalococcoidia bacterium]|nr:DUF2703 domain-containing protein [Dehalococcoidia bacterium]
MRIEFLWFRDCPNHQPARELLRAVLQEKRISEAFVEDIDATGPDVAAEHRFPGSPTVRVNGKDVEPGFQDPGEYTPRCRLYLVGGTFQG